MKLLLIAAIAAVSLLTVAGVANATAGGNAGAYGGSSTWKPGTNWRVTEQNAQDLLEQTYDHAFCTGVARFGHDGEFPDENYRVFDCAVELNAKYCPGARYSVVKADRRWYFHLRLMKTGECY